MFDLCARQCELVKVFFSLTILASFTDTVDPGKLGSGIAGKIAAVYNIVILVLPCFRRK